MTDETIVPDRMQQMLDGKFKKPVAAAREKGADEARAARAIDGRIRSEANERGYTQLNVRVPVDLKNQVIEAARRRPKQKDKGQMTAVIEEALREYFARRRAEQGA